jgi:hypothetical protein
VPFLNPSIVCAKFDYLSRWSFAGIVLSLYFYANYISNLAAADCLSCLLNFCCSLNNAKLSCTLNSVFSLLAIVRIMDRSVLSVTSPKGASRRLRAMRFLSRVFFVVLFGPRHHA